jgi:hypothetical protein
MEIKCELCGKTEGRFESHHQCYNPELMSILCNGCHRLLHHLAKYSPGQIQIALSWIQQYSQNWDNGRWKYLHSE